MDKKYRTGVLGATGAVGQKLLQLLQDHPLFQLVDLCASSRSAGKPYREAVTWRAPGELPKPFASMILRPCEPGPPLDLVFSALPKETAATVEPAFARAGVAVVSNASAFRMTPDVPLVIPEINPDHMNLLDTQQNQRNWRGFIATNPNCATIGLAIPLAALERAFGLQSVSVVTFQARSGAGYPGPPQEAIGDNVLPYIGGEEDKLETEPQKILGNFHRGQILPADFKVSAACHRVDLSDGHFEAVSCKFKRNPTDGNEIRQVLTSFKGDSAQFNLPSTPSQIIRVYDQPDRPQPKLDRDVDGGMTTHVGRIRPCPVLDWKFNLLSHNTIRGAAGAALLNGELLAAQGRLRPTTA